MVKVVMVIYWVQFNQHFMTHDAADPLLQLLSVNNL